MGKASDYSVEEYEFVFKCINRGLGNSEICEEIKSEEFRVTLGSSRFLNNCRKAFTAAKKVQEIQLKKELDPIVAERKKKHMGQLSKIAKSILGPLSGVVLSQYIDEDGAEKYDYEWDRVDDNGIRKAITITHEELVQGLIANIQGNYDKYRGEKLYTHFLTHLQIEIPDLSNSSMSALMKYAKASPLELIESLELLAQKKTFKGKCAICEDW